MSRLHATVGMYRFASTTSYEVAARVDGMLLAARLLARYRSPYLSASFPFNGEIWKSKRVAGARESRSEEHHSGQSGRVSQPCNQLIVTIGRGHPLIPHIAYQTEVCRSMPRARNISFILMFV